MVLYTQQAAKDPSTIGTGAIRITRTTSTFTTAGATAAQPNTMEEARKRRLKIASKTLWLSLHIFANADGLCQMTRTQTAVSRTTTTTVHPTPSSEEVSWLGRRHWSSWRLRFADGLLLLRRIRMRGNEFEVSIVQNHSNVDQDTSSFPFQQIFLTTFFSFRFDSPLMILHLSSLSYYIRELSIASLPARCRRRSTCPLPPVLHSKGLFH